MKLAQAIDWGKLVGASGVSPSWLGPAGGGAGIASFLSSLLPAIFALAGILLLIYLLYGGYMLMISGGDPKAAQQAKSVITQAFFGFLVVFISYWLIQAIGYIFKLSGVLAIFR